MPEPRSSNRRARGEKLSRLLHLMDKFDDKIIVPIVVVSMLAMAVLISADAFYRYALDGSLIFVPKVVTKLLMVLVIFAGLNHATRHRAHVRVDVLTSRMPKSLDMRLTALFDGFIILILVGIAYESYLLGAAASNPLIGAFDIPPRVSLLIISAGCVFAALRLTVSLVLRLLGVEQDEEKAEPMETGI